MLLSLFPNWWEDWLLYHKTVFDGENRLIYVSPGTSSISVKTDLYSSWKEWVSLRDNAKFLPALRTIGGDPIGAGQYAGDMYFLMNGWQIVVDQPLAVSGVLYHDDPISPYIIQSGGGVTSTVSSLAIAYNAGSGVGTVEQVRDAVWSATNLSLYDAGSAGKALNDVAPSLTSISSELSTVKTQTDSLEAGVASLSSAVASIPDAVRTELSPELAKIMTLESNPGLTPSQATMLLEMYELLGLDPTKPLVVTTSARTAGSISQMIITSDSQTIVSRV